MILDKLHALLTKMFLLTTQNIVMSDEVFGRIQTVMFIGTFAGIFTALLAAMFSSNILAFITLVLILPPLAWDRVQMFLITLPDEEEA